MVKSIRNKIEDFILEILLAVILSVAAILWGFNTSIAANDVQVKNNKESIHSLKSDIEELRKENKSDHKDIIREIKERLP